MAVRITVGIGVALGAGGAAARTEVASPCCEVTAIDSSVAIEVRGEDRGCDFEQNVVRVVVNGPIEEVVANKRGRGFVGERTGDGVESDNSEPFANGWHDAVVDINEEC